MESKANYTLVGLLVVILLAGLLTTGLWLSVGFDQKKYNTYVVYMEEAVSGLNDESLVKFNGVKVGYINEIKLNKADPQKVKILLKIQEGTPITICTKATLIAQGITGTTYLGLSVTSSNTTPLVKKPGEKYPVIPYEPSFLNKLEQTIEDLSESLNRMLNQENTKNLTKILHDLEIVTNVFANNKKSINATLQELPKLLNDVRSSVDSFTDMSHDVATAGKQLNNTMKAGRNAIDKISQQAIPPAVILLQRLDVIATNLEKMSVEMRQNPSVIIRGTAPPKLGPGESR